MNRTVLVMTVMLIVSISTMGVAGAETNGIHNENVTDNLIIRIVKPILNVTVEPLVVVKGCTLRIWGDTTLDRVYIYTNESHVLKGVCELPNGTQVDTLNVTPFNGKFRVEVEVTANPGTYLIYVVAPANESKIDPTADCHKVFRLIVTSKPAVYLDSVVKHPNTDVIVRFYIANVVDSTGFNFTLTYDTDVVKLVSVTPNNLSGQIFTNIDNDRGFAKVVVINTNGITAKNLTPVLNLKFHVVGSRGFTDLNLEGVVFSDKNFSVFTPLTINGSLKVAMKGDLNENDLIDIGDLCRISSMVVGLSKPDLLADINDNGRVDIGDVVKMAYYLLGKIVNL